MKKFIVPLAAAAALAIVPSSALAVGDWGGWGQSHSDNLASPNYATSFSNNGPGNSQYCVDPTTTSTSCGPSGVYSPVETAGVFIPTKTGCSHETPATAKSDNNNAVQIDPDGAADPCAAGSGDSVGAFYIGFAGGNGIIGAQG